jgi:hypothetical protein
MLKECPFNTHDWEILPENMWQEGWKGTMRVFRFQRSWPRKKIRGWIPRRGTAYLDVLTGDACMKYLDRPDADGVKRTVWIKAPEDLAETMRKWFLEQGEFPDIPKGSAHYPLYRKALKLRKAVDWQRR